MPKSALHLDVQLGPQGRVVIPSPLRRTLGFEPGDVLIARVENERLILEKPEVVKRRLKARFASLSPGKSLAAELLQERRKESNKEACS